MLEYGMGWEVLEMGADVRIWDGMGWGSPTHPHPSHTHTYPHPHTFTPPTPTTPTNESSPCFFVGDHKFIKPLPFSMTFRNFGGASSGGIAGVSWIGFEVGWEWLQTWGLPAHVCVW